jgi:hypothetical protein
MTPAEIAVWVGIVAGSFGVIGGFFASLKFIHGAGGEKQEYRDKYRELRDDVDALQQKSPFCITKEQCDREHKAFQESVSKQIEIQVHNGLGEVKEQLSDLNGMLCYFMGQMNVSPPQNPKRRRQSDNPSPSVL